MYHLLFAGSGLIGCGLAANALSHHQDVTLYDIRDADEVKDRRSSSGQRGSIGMFARKT